MVKQYFKLIRPFHWVKNLLILAPLFFSDQLFDKQKLSLVTLGFIAFSFIASSVYIINDIQDAEKDRTHPKKRYRPIASGKISKQSANIVFFLLIAISLLIMIYLGQKTNNVLSSFGLPLLYLLLNIAYSNGLKNLPLVDVIIIASGFVIRLLYGGVLANIKISSSLLLTVISASMFLGFGKRRNELKKGTSTRKVLKAYNMAFLDKIMYVFITLTLVFYSLWVMDNKNYLLVYSVPVAMIIVATYCLIIESNKSDGDPAEVLKHSKSLLVLLVLFILLLFLSIY